MQNPFKVFANVRTLQAQISDLQKTAVEQGKSIDSLKSAVRDFHASVIQLIGQDAQLAELKAINQHIHYLAIATRKDRAQRGHHD